MTKQEILNKVWDYFIVEKHPKAYDVRCCYRTKDGYKCAIGCLIPDELYQHKWDVPDENCGIGTGVDELYACDKDFKNFIDSLFDSKVEISFLARLQGCHDLSTGGFSEFHTSMKNNLTNLALELDLKVPQS